MMNRCWPGFALALVIFGFGTNVYADDLAAADALFKKGVAELKAGNFAEACPAFAESQRLDPRPGTIYAMAECESKAGRIATAMALYDDFLRTVGSIKSTAQQLKYLERSKKAQAERDTLAAEVPQLTVLLPAGAPADVRMTRNGEAFTTASLGVAIPVNPGEQVITVQLATGPVNEQKVTLAKGEQKTVTLQLPSVQDPPKVVKTPQPVVSGPTPSATEHSQVTTPLAPVDIRKPTTSGTTTPEPQSRPDSRVKIRTAGVVIGGVGLAGLVMGAVTGGMILQKKPFIDKSCPNHLCNDAGLKEQSTIPTLNVMNAAGLGVGVAGVVTGGLMLAWGNKWFGAKQSKADVRVEAMVFGSQDAFVVMKGAF